MKSSGMRLVRGVSIAGLVAAVIVGVASAGARRATVAPANTTPPSISGGTASGSTVTANPGTWTGTAPITYSYQWQICGQNGSACHDISGATNQTYQIQQGDQGNTLRVVVTAKNADGSNSATSNASGGIGAGGPTSSAAPTISGSLTEGSTVTAQNGTWSGAQPIAFTYQWEICDQNGNACHPISGATSQSYQLQKDDTGNTLRVQVTAKNTDGSTSATSAPSAKIGTAPVSNGCPSLATAVPFNQVTIPSVQKTDSSGNAVLQFNRLRGFPAAQHQQLMVLFVRASKPGENLLAGISTRRLISLRVDLRHNV